MFQKQRMSETSALTVAGQEGARILRLDGRLTLARMQSLPSEIAEMQGQFDKIDISGVERLDTTGAWFLHRQASEHGVEIVGAGKEAKALINVVGESDAEVKLRPQESNAVLRLLNDIGEGVVQAGRTLFGLLNFFGAICISVGMAIRHPGRFRFNAVVHRFDTVGVRSLGIIGLMSFLIGIVVAQQGAVQLRQFGAEMFTINLIGRITFRELGPLMTAIMVAGRSGSAFAAQIGTMKLTEEVDAMRVIGVSPVDALILPRVLAVTVMMPLLAMFSCVIAIIGGALMCWVGLDIPPVTYFQRLQEVVPMTDVYAGLVKAPVFGLLIGMSGCFQGMQVSGNSEDVGIKTTAAVVQAIFLVIVLDAFFAVFFTSIGWD